jgi:hypothetical protein
MIDDAFLRQAAALQANLKMLESQQDALSDLADMQALRLYKARLFDYIESHSNAGHLPPDPFQSIERRIVALSEFFSVADWEFKRLKGWKQDWLNGVPSVTLGDLHFAIAELEEKARALGFSLAELTGAVTKIRRRASATPKYANPADQSETWSGRGRKPRWFVAALKAGKSPEDLAI